MSTTYDTDAASNALTSIMRIVVFTDIRPGERGFHLLSAPVTADTQSGYDGSASIWESVSRKIDEAIHVVKQHPDFPSWVGTNVKRNRLGRSCRKWRTKVEETVSALNQQDAEVASTEIKVRAYKPYGTLSEEALQEEQSKLVAEAEAEYQAYG